MDFTQLAGNYLANRMSNRMNQAVAPFEDPMAYLGNRMDANVAPVQTDTINPAEAATQDFVPGGELAIERPGVPISQYLAQARQMSLARQQNPNVNAPVQPEPELPPQAFPDPNAQAITSNYAPAGQNQGGYAASQQMPAAGTRVDQTQPVQQTTEQAITSNYAPAGQNQGGYAASVPAPSVPSLDSEAAAMSAAPDMFAEMQRRNAYNMNFSQGQNDLKTVSSIAFDDAAPGAVKFAANDKLRTAVNNLADIKTKTAEVDAALGDPSGKGAMKMLNAIAREREDGSLLKAIFYQRMGLNDLAKSEQMKLGAMDTYQPVALPDGRQGYVKVNYQGAPVAGWTDTGAMSPDELINARVGVKGSEIGTQAYKHRGTDELYFLRRTPQGQAQMVNTKGQVFTGNTAELFAYGIGSDLQIQREKLTQEFQIKLANEPTLEGCKSYAKTLMESAQKSDPGDGSHIRAAQERINNLGLEVPTGGTTTGRTTTGGTTTTEQQAAPIAPDTTANVPSKPVVKDTSIDTMRVAPEVQQQRDQGRLATLSQERANLERDLAAEKNPASRAEIQKLLAGNAREIAATQKNLRGQVSNVPTTTQVRTGDQVSNVPTTTQVRTGGATYTPGQFNFRAQRPGEGEGAYERDRKAAQDAFNIQEQRNKTIFEENLKREQAVRQQQEMIPGEVNQVEQTKFIDTGLAVKKQSEDARVVAGARKRQLGVIKENPQVVGLMYGSGSSYDHARNYVLNLLNGYYDDPIKAQEKRIALDTIGKAGLADAVAQIETDAALINSKTIRETAQVGAITDFEQNKNTKLNLGNVTAGHPMAVANKFNQHLFASNLTINKDKFLNDGALAGRFKTDREFNQAWGKEENRLLKEYEGIYEARMRMIKPYEDALRKDPTNTKLIDDRKRAILHSMSVYPAPEYNSSTNSWSYGSDAARKAAKKAVIENVLKGKK